jgi:hypothetical protein
MLRIDPALPMLRIEPALPMLRMDPALPMLRIEHALPMQSSETTLKKLATLKMLKMLKTLPELDRLRQLGRLLAVRRLRPTAASIAVNTGPTIQPDRRWSAPDSSSARAAAARWLYLRFSSGGISPKVLPVPGTRKIGS